MQTNKTDLQQITTQITSCLGKLDQAMVTNASYETGLLGYSLYFALLAKSAGDISHLKTAEEYFEKAMEALNIEGFERVYNTDSIDGHLSHIGRFLLFVAEHDLMDIDSEDYLQQLDNILADLMKSKISIKDFDSLSGAMASGYYFLARHERGTNMSSHISELVHGLENFAEHDNEGDYFWHSPSLYNRVYIGISHGSALMISFLSRAIDLGIEIELSKKIIRKASNFIRKQYRISPYTGLFPNMIGDPIEPMQFALCYGDIGTGYALYLAAEKLEDQSLMSFANLILEDCLKRSRGDEMTLDASIFYGASGLVIAFEKLFTVTGDKRFIDRANYWFDQIESYQIYENEFAGFQSRLKDADLLWNITFGWGIIGIGCTLLSYPSKNLPSLSSLTFIA